MFWSIHNGDPAIYWILKIIVYIILFICGYNISIKNGNYKKNASIACVAYSLFIGLRWLRGPDYFYYYNHLIDGFADKHYEPLYRMFVSISSMILPYWGTFILYSLLFIGGAFYLSSRYPKASVYFFPLFCLINEEPLQNFIRQDFAVSLILIALGLFCIGKKKESLACALLAPFIHGVSVVLIAVIIPLLYIDIIKKISKPWLFIGVYVALYMFWDPTWIIPLTVFLQTLNIGQDDSLQRYLTNADFWLLEKDIFGSSGKQTTSSILYVFASQGSIIATIYYGFKTAKLNRDFSFFFVLSYLAIILEIIAGSIEILVRIVMLFNIFTPFIIAYSLTYLKIRNSDKYIMIAIWFLYYGFYNFIWQIGKPGFAGCAFVWDK